MLHSERFKFKHFNLLINNTFKTISILKTNFVVLLVKISVSCIVFKNVLTLSYIVKPLCILSKYIKCLLLI